jgi:small GTP-binding protein
VQWLIAKFLGIEEFKMADCSISSFDLGKPQPEGKTPGQPSSYFDMLMKMLIVGNSSVGKTNLLNRLAGQRFCNSYVSTIGLDFKVKSIQVKDRVVKLQMWDTAGQERFRTLTKTYYQAASIVLVVFSVNDRESVEYTESWLKQIDELCGQEVRKILVANKLDIAESDRLVSS